MAGPKRLSSAELLHYLEGRVGQTVWINEIETAFPVASKQNIQNAIGRLTDEGKLHVEVLVRGNKWRIEGAGTKAASKRLFEELATTRSGQMLVQDEDGNVYRLEEL